MALRSRVLATVSAVLALVAAGVAPTQAAPPTTHTIRNGTVVQAEDFGSGATAYVDTTPKNFGGAYRDTAVDIAEGGSGYYVGWTAEGESLTYSLDVVEAGTYAVTFRVASNTAGRTLSVTADGRAPASVTLSAADGWGQWREVTAQVGQLTSGRHSLQIQFGNGKLDVDSFRFAIDETTTPPPPTGPGAQPGRYPGRPVAGDVLWGATYGSGSGNNDLAARYERAAGQPLEVHRAFFQWSQRTGSMITTAREDIAAGRVPWVSVKPPSWAAMASGRYDSEIDAMLRALNALNGPVWLTIHHEPEGGGGVNASDDPAGPAGHLAMNTQVRERMTALGVDNVALAPILMAWTWNPLSGRDVNQYWAPGVYDFVGIDTYSYGGASLITDNWQRVRTWSAQMGVDVAVAEYGIRGDSAQTTAVMRELYDRALLSSQDRGGARVVALCVSDSAPKGWPLGSSQLAEFRRILASQ